MNRAARPAPTNKREDISSVGLENSPAFFGPWITIMHTTADWKLNDNDRFHWLTDLRKTYDKQGYIYFYDYYRNSKQKNKLQAHEKQLEDVPGVYEWQVNIRPSSASSSDNELLKNIKPLSFYMGKSNKLLYRIYGERTGRLAPSSAFTDVFKQVYKFANSMAHLSENFRNGYEFAFEVRVKHMAVVEGETTNNEGETTAGETKENENIKDAALTRPEAKFEKKIQGQVDYAANLQNNGARRPEVLISWLHNIRKAMAPIIPAEGKHDGIRCKNVKIILLNAAIRLEDDEVDVNSEIAELVSKLDDMVICDSTTDTVATKKIEVGRAAVDEQLKKLKLSTRDVSGDGNCLFRAISYAIYGSEDSHHKIRALVANYVNNNKAAICITFGLNNKQFDLLVAELSTSREAAGEEALYVLSTIFQRDIIVYTGYAEPLVYSPAASEFNGSHNAPIRIAFQYKDGVTYPFI
jgi:hypothetical protein